MVKAQVRVYHGAKYLNQWSSAIPRIDLTNKVEKEGIK
jgi:hypothetical protein